MSQIYLVANWKANKTLPEAYDWTTKLGQASLPPAVQIVICPPFPFIPELHQLIRASALPFVLGAQDVSRFESGAYTGEVTAPMLASMVDFCLVGHSERRTNFGEDDGVIAEKVAILKKSGIEPIVCVTSEKTSIPPGATFVAYEPPEAIGSGNPEPVSKVIAVVQAVQAKGVGNVFYGGSVSRENVASFLKNAGVEGLLVGQSSLSVDEFISLAQAASF